MKLQIHSEILKAAKEVIKDEKNWVQHHYAAMNKEANYSVAPNSPLAKCFCSRGAILKVCDVSSFAAAKEQEMFEAEMALDILRKAAPIYGDYEGCSVARFNDTHTHAEVMEMWDKAIKLAEEAEFHDVDLQKLQAELQAQVDGED